jgi:glycosyltransferase involved in cell wall biosynthesis
MRILFIAPSAYLLGGVQDWLYSLCIGLRSRGHEIIIGVPNNKFHQVDQYNDVFEGLEAVGFTNRSGSPEGRIRSLCRFLMKYRADIIVGVNIGDLYEAFNRVCERLTESRIVLTLHAIEANYFADIGRYSYLLDGIITTNRLSQSIVRSMKVMSDNRVYYAPYGVEIKTKVNQTRFADTLKVAWVGRLENNQKRLSDLVNMLRRLDDTNIMYSLSIAGDGPYRNRLKEDLGPWIDNGKVRMMGVLSKKELGSFYSNNNVLLITSQWETGPIVAWEAMAAGLVVISSEYIGHGCEKALIHNETSLLFPIGDMNEACRQIGRLTNSELREEIAKRGKKLALARYSTKASLDQWELAFEEIMSHKPRQREAHDSVAYPESSGRLESILGRSMSEHLRLILSRWSYAKDPGSEWPHSIHEIHDQTKILNYASEIEALNK